MGHILRRNCLLKYVIEGWTEVTGRRGRRLKQHLKNGRIWKLKEEALGLTMWRTGFGRGCGPGTGQTAEA
jgi:hypothetical protein